MRNSPKMPFVKNFAIWLVTVDQEKLSEVLSSDEAIWIGKHQSSIVFVSRMNPNKAAILGAIANVGLRAAAVNWTMAADRPNLHG